MGEHVHRLLCIRVVENGFPLPSGTVCQRPFCALRLSRPDLFHDEFRTVAQPSTRPWPFLRLGLKWLEYVSAVAWLLCCRSAEDWVDRSGRSQPDRMWPSLGVILDERGHAMVTTPISGYSRIVTFKSTTTLPVLFDSLHGSCIFPAIPLRPPEEPESWHLTERACKSRLIPSSRRLPTFTESLFQPIFLPAAILGDSSRSSIIFRSVNAFYLSYRKPVDRTFLFFLLFFILDFPRAFLPRLLWLLCHCSRKYALEFRSSVLTAFRAGSDTHF